MRRHISIFAFLLGAFAATAQVASKQVVNGGYYAKEKGSNVSQSSIRMSVDGTWGRTSIELVEGQEATFRAFPESGFKVSQWGVPLRYPMSGTDAMQYAKYKWTDSTSETHVWSGKPADGDGYLAVNFDYIRFDITFDKNGADRGAQAMDPLTDWTIDTVKTQLPPCTFTRTGYEMVGWSNAVYWAAQKKAIPDGATVKGEDFWNDAVKNFDGKLIALWKTNTYSIAYDANDGVISKPGPTSADFGGVFEVVHPAKAGSQFKGWKVIEGLDPTTAKWGSTAEGVSSSISDANTLCRGNGDSTFFKSVSSATNGKVKLQAVWDSEGYTVTFDNQGADSGRGGISSMTVEYKVKPRDLEENEIPSKTGFDFLGYFETTAGQTMHWSEEGVYVKKSWPYTEGKTLYAGWNAHHYSISYAGLEDATGYPTSAAYGETFALARPAKTGYKFAGWNVSKGLESRDAKWGESSDLVNRSLDYEWTRIKPDDQNPDGTVYIKNLNTNDSAQVTLTANWVEVKYKATFEIAGANNNPTKEVEVTYDVGLPNVTTVPTYESGEIFRGYFTEPNGRGEKYWNANGTPAKEKWTVAGDLKLYECKTGFDYYITYDANGGEGSVPQQSCNSSNDVTLASGNELHRSGFRLCGWDFNKDHSSEECAFRPLQTVSASGLKVKKDGDTATLFAIWQDKHVRIAIDATGGTAYTNGVKVTSLTYVDGEEYGFLPTAEKPHYDFVGWFTQAEGGERILEDSIVDYESVKTLYAQWTPERYSVAFDGNGATNGDAMAVQEFAWDEEKSLSQNLYGRTGYTFDGWATNAVTMKKVFDDCQIVSNLVGMADATQTVFAVWHTNGYTVVFNPNGAGVKETMEPQNFFYDEAKPLSPNLFTRGEMWSFAGWSNAVGRVFADGETVSNLCADDGGRVNLFARWTSERGPLSEAMGCDNLKWISDLVWDRTQRENLDAWEVCTTNGFGGSCAQFVRAGSTLNLSTMHANIGTNGTLTFKWQPSGGSSRWLSVVVEGTKDPIEYYFNAEEGGNWSDAKVTIPEFADGGTGVQIKIMSDGGICFVDQMTWVPEGAHPEPGPADAVKISSAAVSDGKFVLSFPSDARFDYNLLTNANLLIDSWGVRGTLVGDGNILTFKPQISEDQPQLFYKVETIQRK